MSGENSWKLIGDSLEEEEEEQESSSFSSGMLGMSGYSRSWGLVSSGTRGRVGVSLEYTFIYLSSLNVPNVKYDMDLDTHLKYGCIENVENMKVQKYPEELKYWYNSTLHFLHLIICQN